MSATAERQKPHTDDWELVNASALGETDRDSIFRCASCKKPTHLVIRSKYDNYFRSDEHAIGCPVAMGHKVIHLNTNTHIDLDAILNHVDQDPIQRKENRPKNLAGDTGSDDLGDADIDTRFDKDGTRTICTAGGMYRELIEKMGSSPMDDFAARNVNSIFLRRDTLRAMKANWGSPIKLVVTKRCFPDKLKYKIPVPNGYVTLRDAYSYNDEDAIYFLVKMNHPDRDKDFKTRIFGKSTVDPNSVTGEKKYVGKDPHRNIVILARWQREPHGHYQVYRAVLNSRMVAFVNASDAN